VGAGLILTMSSTAQAQTSHTRVFTFMLPDGTSAADDTVGWARLHRSGNGARLSLKTTRLGPGSAYSVWWVIFNNPEACGDDGCDGGDFPNPEVEASVMNATGRVADENGNALFAAFLPAGLMHTNPDRGNVRQVFGPGLQNVAGAEIHIVVKCHGEASGNPEQLSTVDADCVADDGMGGAVCFDAQAAVFPLPRRRFHLSESKLQLK
jgi:hypothetical protein